jgi:GcrA cell cycle regulator
MSPWTSEIIDRLRQHMADGLSAKECAAELKSEFQHSFTRNSVIGKAQRIGLRPGSLDMITREKQRKRDGIKHPRKGRVLKLHKPPMARAPLAWPEPVTVDDLRIPQAQRLTLVELENHHCRFPIGEVGSPDFFFCGAPTADMAGGRPYCRAHARRAYHSNSTPVSERAQARMSRLGHWAVRAAE